MIITVSVPICIFCQGGGGGKQNRCALERMAEREEYINIHPSGPSNCVTVDNVEHVECNTCNAAFGTRQIPTFISVDLVEYGAMDMETSLKSNETTLTGESLERRQTRKCAQKKKKKMEEAEDRKTLM